MARVSLAAALGILLCLFSCSCESAPISVIDEGRFTTRTDGLSVSWSVEAGADLVLYRYAVGTTPYDPGSGYAFGWTVCGTDTSAEISPVSLQNGVTYYVYVEGMDSGGNWVHYGQSDGILAVTGAGSPAAAKAQPEGSWVSVSGIASTATGDLPRRVYIQAPDRSSGIPIDTAGMAPPLFQRGQTLLVYGTVSSLGGERCIAADTIIPSGSPAQVPPLAMTNRSVGGGDFSYSPGPPERGQMGVEGGVGSNNIGLLIRTTGMVTHVDASGRFVYIDDGSALDDGSTHRGIKVILNGLSAPGLDEQVMVTGVSSCEPGIGAKPVRVIRVRNQQDITVVGGGPVLNMSSDLLYAVTGARNGVFRVRLPSPVPSDLTVTLVSKDPGKLLLAPFNQAVPGAATLQLTIPAGSAESNGFDVIGVAHGAPIGQLAGDTVIQASAPGYGPGSAHVNIYQSGFRWNTGNLHWTLAPIQVKMEVGANNLGWGYRLAQNTTVSLAGANPAVVGTGTTTIANNTTYSNGTVTTTGVGTTTVTATTPQGGIAATTFGPVTITQPTLVTDEPWSGTGARSYAYNVHTTGYEYAPDDVSITLSPLDTGVAGLALYDSSAPAADSVQVVIPKGQNYSNFFEIIGRASGGAEGSVAGATNLSMAAGIATFYEPLKVYQTALQISVTSPPTTLAPADLYVGIGARHLFSGLRAAQETAVDVSSSDTGILGNTAVTLPNNAGYAYGQSATNGVGTATLTASTSSAPILPGDTGPVTVTGPGLQFDYAVFEAGTDVRSGSFWLRAPSPVTTDTEVTIAVADPSVALVSRFGSGDPGAESITLTIPAGSYGPNDYFELIGVASGANVGDLCGTTTVTASTPGFASASAEVNVYQSGFYLDIYPQDPNLTTLNPASLYVAFTCGEQHYTQMRAVRDMEVQIVSSDTDVLGETSFVMLNNASYAEPYPEVATVAPGTAELTASTTSAAILEGRSGPRQVRPPFLSLNDTDLVTGTGARHGSSPYWPYAYVVQTPSPAPTDITLTLQVAHPSVALLAVAGSGEPAADSITLTIPQGYNMSQAFEVIGVAQGSVPGELCGTTTVTASAGGFVDGVGAARVYQSALTVSLNPPTTTLGPIYTGVGLAIPGVWSGSLSAARDIVVDLTTSDPSVLGNGTITLPNASAYVYDYAVPTTGEGTAHVTASTTSAPILEGVSEDVTVTAPGLGFANTPLVTGTGARYCPYYGLGYCVALPSAAPTDITITLTSENPAVATLAPAYSGQAGAASTTVTVSAGQSYSSPFELIGVAHGGAEGDVCGTTSITASAPGFISATEVATVYQTAFAVSGNPEETLLHPASFTVRFADNWWSGWGWLRAAHDFDISITSNDDSVLGNTSVRLPNDASSIEGWAPTVGLGTATLTANTTSLHVLNGTSQPITVVQPYFTVYPYGPDPLQTATGCYNYGIVSIPGAVGAPYAITVTLSVADPSVALLSPDGLASSAVPTLQVVINPGETSAYFYLVGVATAAEPWAVAGETTVSISAPGFVSSERAVQVLQSGLQVTASSLAYVGEQIWCQVAVADPTMGWWPALAGPVQITLSSSNPSVVPSASVLMDAGSASAYFYLDTLSAGTTTITATPTSGSILPGVSNEVVVQ